MVPSVAPTCVHVCVRTEVRAMAQSSPFAGRGEGAEGTKVLFLEHTMFPVLGWNTKI